MGRSAVLRSSDVCLLKSDLFDFSTEFFHSCMHSQKTDNILFEMSLKLMYLELRKSPKRNGTLHRSELFFSPLSQCRLISSVWKLSGAFLNIKAERTSQQLNLIFLQSLKSSTQFCI
jgi:hypothetical protein